MWVEVEEEEVRMWVRVEVGFVVELEIAVVYATSA